VLDLLNELLQRTQPHITQGVESRELAPEYFLNAAGNLLDIVNGDLAADTMTSAGDVGNVSWVIGRRVTIESTVQLIDRIMIVIFQVCAIIITFTN